MDLELNGRVAIVTGAGRGLGRAIASALIAEGASVLGAARSAAELDSLRAEAPEAIRTVVCDMRDPAAVADLAARALDAFGRLDVVVNNAGIAPAGAFVDQGDELWAEVFAVNVFAPMALARAAAESFIEQGSGKVINVASTSGLRGKPALVAYSASKGALLQATQALAAEWGPHAVQVNAIAPGAFATEAQRVVLDSPDLHSRRVRKIPAGRMAQPREIGALACLLASPQSNFITGATFTIDGGEVSKL